MIKTLISIILTGTIVGLLLTFGEVFSILLQFKSTMIFYMGIIFSRLALGVILIELTYSAIHYFTKKL